DPAARAPGAVVHGAVRVPDRVGRVPIRADLHVDDRRQDDPGRDRRVHRPIYDRLRAAGRGRDPRGDPAGADRGRVPALHRRRPGLRGGEGMSSAFREAIYRQPENLRAASDAFREAIDDVDVGALCTGTVVLSGIGASASALIPAMVALRAAGRRAFAVSAGELRVDGAARLGDAFVLVSQSGASAETVDALRYIEGAPVVAISAKGDSPLAQAADVWLPLGPLPDTPVATLSYTATLQALGMLCDALLGTASAWDRVPELAAEVLERTDPVVERIARQFAQVRALDAVGG